MANSVAVDSREKIPTSLAELIGINPGFDLRRADDVRTRNQW